MTRLQVIEDKMMKSAEATEFGIGDTVRVSVRIVEGDKERLQAFEGTCIARRNRGARSTFTIRKVSNGVGVERVFPLYGPVVGKIELISKGKVRRAKLYYLRELKGKAARITRQQGAAGSVAGAK